MHTAKFKDYNLSEPILKSLDLMGFDHPTGVQAKVIPEVLNRKDIIVKSQTGSGKTAAFGIPICDMIDWEENKPQALVLTPTRELAVQVKEDLFHIGRLKRLKISAVFGKSPFHLQEKQLKQKTHMVVGTPGRLIDHLDQGTLDVSMIKYLVVDEADEMLRMGFIDQIDDIISMLPKDRVTILLSATLPEHIQSLCKKYMIDPIFVDVEDTSPAATRIEQGLMHTEASEKMKLLKSVLITENPDSCMIFCNTQGAVEEIGDTLSSSGYSADKIHGGMEQKDRLRVMDSFRNGGFRFLVATDVAARGIDIDNISLVINFDVPNNRENYVHRIGRTGRIGNQGKAITFCAPYETSDLQDVCAFIGRTIEEVAKPVAADVQLAKADFEAKRVAEPEKRGQKADKLNEDILKLHIRGGKKTKMRAVDVVGGICAIDGVEAKDIGIINILDLSTYVEILHGKGELVLKALETLPVKGRVRIVTRAEK